MLPDSVLYIRQAGLQDWQITSEAMHQFTDNRQPDTPDEIWLVQHPPVFTQGQAGKAEHILSPGNIPVVNSDRGGQVTYHGPGQQVMYVLLDIRRRKLGVRQFVTALEETVIETLASFDMEARARPEAPGVYIGQRKICSLGLRIRHGCSLHGLALNINMDLAPFLRINPCGYAGMEMTQMRDVIPDISPAEVTPVLVRQFVQKLGYSNILRSREDQLDVPFFLQCCNPDHP